MATINDKFFADLAGGASWAAGVSFQRSNPLPLDKYSVFESKEAAETYASTNAVAYPGQIVAVVNEGVMEVYVLAEKANRVAEGEEQIYSLALQEMGTKIEVDPNSLGNNSLGLLEMLGFENAANLTLPQKKDGKVQWLPISEIAKGDGNDNTTYTVALGADGKSINITTYENGVAVTGEDGQVIVQNIALDIYTKAETDAAITVEKERAEAAEGELSTAIEGLKTSKADATSVYTKDETDTKIGDAVKEILGEDVSEAYDTFKEIQVLMAGDGGESAGLIANVAANKTALDILNGSATEEGSVAKTVADAIAAENLSQYAKASDVTTIDGRVTELETNSATKAELENYVTKQSADIANGGTRFITQEEINKLSKLNLTGDEITISGTVNASQVKSLYSTVSAIIKGSSADLDPDTDGDQLGLNIEEGAQVNKIEKVVFNGTEATIEGKIATIAGEYYTKSEVDTKVKAASDAASEANTLAGQAKAAAEANAQTLSATNETVASHTKKITDLETANTQHGASITTLQGTVDSHIADIAQLKIDVQSATATANANNTAIGELKAADQTINTELTRLESVKANAADVYTKEATVAEIKKITGEPTEGMTIIDMINAIPTFDDTQIKADIKTNADNIAANTAAIEKLNGNDQVVGSVDYKVAQEVAKILNDSDESDIDTLEEIAAWITNDTTGAAKMNKDIAANTAAITTLNGASTVEGSIDYKIAQAAPTIATTTTAGLVKASATDAVNGVSVADDGAMTVNKINVDLLVQDEGSYLILNGGNADS